MRVVLDTNVFISGIFWEGNFSSKIIEAWKKRKFDLIASVSIIEELEKTLRTFKIQMGEEMIKELKRIIIENAIIIEPKKKLHIIKEDPDDNKFLEVALEGQAQYIVSQDKHLLNLKEFSGIKIITPERFLKLTKI